MTKAESFAMQYGYYDKEKKHACCVGYNAGYKQAEKDVKDALLEWAKDHQEGERQGSYTWSCYQIFIDKLNEMQYDTRRFTS